MRDIGDGDIEAAHYEGDKLMMEVLRELGYEAGVAIFDARDAWYA